MRQAEPAERDAVVAALLRFGATDKCAPMVLAWLLVPGASLLAGRLQNLVDVIDEVVAGQLWIQITITTRLLTRTSPRRSSPASSWKRRPSWESATLPTPPTS